MKRWLLRIEFGALLALTLVGLLVTMCAPERESYPSRGPELPE